MPFTLTSSVSSEIPEKIAAVLPELKFPILFLAITALVIVTGLFLYRNFPGFQRIVNRSLKVLEEAISPSTREALLNEVICQHCKRGNGVLNPVYRTYNGEPHIEGMCNCCGKFVRARLRS